MRGLIICLAVLGLAWAGQSAEAAAARWSGALGPEPGLPLVLTVADGKASAEFPSLGQAGYEGPVVEAADGAISVNVRTPAGDMKLTGRRRDGAISGDWSFLGRTGPFQLKETAAPVSAWSEEPVLFTGAGDVHLAGVVLSPRAGGRWPAFVGVHGSGVETRAGANRYLAERLVAEGAVVLLFDKRGTGGSSGDWRPARLEDLAGDVHGALAELRKRPNVDRRRLGLLGPSQAGWVGAIVASREPCVSYLMLRSAVLTSVAEEGQYDYLQRLSGQSPAVLAQAKRILDLDDAVTRTGAGWAELQTAIKAAESTAWFALMRFTPAPPDSAGRLSYRAWLDFDPQPLLAKSGAAAFWIYGEADETVPAARSAEIARALKASGKDYEVLTIGGASHALTLGPAKGEAWPHLAADYLPASLDWYRRKVARVAPSPKAGCY